MGGGGAGACRHATFWLADDGGWWGTPAPLFLNYTTLYQAATLLSDLFYRSFFVCLSVVLPLPFRLPLRRPSVVLPPSFRRLSACPCAVPPVVLPPSFRCPSAVPPPSFRRLSACPSAVPPPSLHRPSAVPPPSFRLSFRRPFAVFPLSLLRPGHLVHKVFCQSGVMFRTHEIFQLFLRQMGRDAAVRQRQLL